MWLWAVMRRTTSEHQIAKRSTAVERAAGRDLVLAAAVGAAKAADMVHLVIEGVPGARSLNGQEPHRILGGEVSRGANVDGGLRTVIQHAAPEDGLDVRHVAFAAVCFAPREDVFLQLTAQLRGASLRTAAVLILAARALA